MSDLTGLEISRQTLEAHLKPVLERYDVKWRGHGVIYVDYEHYNIQTLSLILNDLSRDLGVSAQVISSRLVELGLLNDVRGVQPAKNRVEHIVDSILHRKEKDIDTDVDDFEPDGIYD